MVRLLFEPENLKGVIGRAAVTSVERVDLGRLVAGDLHADADFMDDWGGPRHDHSSVFPYPEPIDLLGAIQPNTTLIFLTHDSVAAGRPDGVLR